jgi:sugar-specific transcriptional regulator TrmB
MNNELRSAESTNLSGLGVTAPEERAYIALLRRDGATSGELAEALEITSAAAEKLLDSLQVKGFATHAPDTIRRYFAVPPDIAVEALIERRQSELRYARASIGHLRDIASARAARGRSDDRLIEVLSPDASMSAIPQMIKSARHEILALERLPLIASPAGAFEEAHDDSFARGVKSRSVTDSNLLRVPGMREPLRREVMAGEEKRVFPNLPIKLILVDRRVGFLPLSLDTASGSNLLVQSPALLGALYELFDMFWNLARPYQFDEAGRLRIGTDAASSASSERTQLLSLLSSGLNDKTIEQELDISSRTFTRRVTALMKELGASTRFHAGWLAAKSTDASAGGCEES